MKNSVGVSIDKLLKAISDTNKTRCEDSFVDLLNEESAYNLEDDGCISNAIYTKRYITEFINNNNNTSKLTFRVTIPIKIYHSNSIVTEVSSDTLQRPSYYINVKWLKADVVHDNVSIYIKDNNQNTKDISSFIANTYTEKDLSNFILFNESQDGFLAFEYKVIEGSKILDLYSKLARIKHLIAIDKNAIIKMVNSRYCLDSIEELARHDSEL